MKPPPGVTEIPAPRPREISGVAAVPGGYVVVGDEESGHGRIWPGGRIISFAQKIQGPESIDVGLSPQGNDLWLILGEDRGRLVDLDGGSYKFPRRFRQKSGRGLEGVALRPGVRGWEVAVCWEGGYFDPDSKRRGEWAAPLLALLTWQPGEGTEGPHEIIELEVPQPSKKQRFRASDLVWDGDGWIVLLASTNAKRNKCKFTWLQRFDSGGRPSGDPMKLEERWGRYHEGKNWEALDWSLDGTQLVMGHDTRKRKAHCALTLFRPMF